MTRPRGRPAHPGLLTPAEWAVLDLYRHGLNKREIAGLRGTGRREARNRVNQATSQTVGLSGHQPNQPWRPLREEDQINAE